MKVKHSLRRFIAWSFAALALVLGGFFALTAYVVVEMAESQLIDERLLVMANRLIQQYKAGQAIQPSVGMRFFANEQIPPEFAHVSPGIHEVFVQDKELHVLVQKIEQQHFVLIDDTSEFEVTERGIYIAVIVSFSISLILAVALGFAIAQRIIHPLLSLARAVTDNIPAESLPSLSSKNEIGVLANAFAARTNELQRFLDRERLFTGDVSHELRTPLTIMLGASELLKAQLQHQPELVTIAERIRRVAEEAGQRVHALLLLSRAPNAVDATPFSLNARVQREIDRCQPLIEGKQIQLQQQAAQDVQVLAPEPLVGILISNLVRNACQYMEAGTITITIRPGVLVIEDDGPGLPEHVRHQLFERYNRGENDLTGSGLGLAIVKRVVEHMQWAITCVCPAGGGCQFTITFPFLP